MSATGEKQKNADKPETAESAIEESLEENNNTLDVSSSRDIHTSVCKEQKLFTYNYFYSFFSYYY